MKAVVATAPHILTVTEVPEPMVGEYDALCEILACGICNGTDNHILEGAAYHKVTFPTIMGHEAIGRVISLGAKVKNYTIGDIVSRIMNTQPQTSVYSVMWGGLAERGIVTDWQALRDDGHDAGLWQKYTINRVLPPDFDPVTGVMLITWRETYSFLARMNAFGEKKVLIIGTGGNALAFVEHLKNAGISALVIGSASRRELFLKAGAMEVIPYTSLDLVNILLGKGFGSTDIIIDAIGKSADLNILLPFLKHGGKIGVYGLDNFLAYSIDATKSQGDFTYYSGEKYDEGSAHDAVMDHIRQGILDPWLYLSRDHIYPLENTADAIQASAERKVIKSVVKISI